jgi:hypothetical protein
MERGIQRIEFGICDYYTITIFLPLNTSGLAVTLIRRGADKSLVL